MLLADTVHGIRKRRPSIVQGILGADYQPQWFAIVAFDQRSQHSDVYRRDLVLVTTADEEKFEKFQSSLEESEEIPDSYKLDVRGGNSALNHATLLGSLPLRLCTGVQDSKSLSLPDTLFSAIDIQTQGVTYTIGVASEEDLSLWLSSLRKAVFAMRKGVVSMKTQKTMMLDQVVMENSRGNVHKWVEEVGTPKCFHIMWYLYVLFVPLWVVALVLFLNPYLAPCDRNAIKLDSLTGQCINIATAEVSDICQSWEAQKGILGVWRSWVELLQPYWFFDPKVVIEGDNQTCFTKVGWLPLIWFWTFVGVQIVEGFFSMGWTAINWRNVVRGAKLLGDMEPKFHSKYWPSIDLFLCHYSEPAEDTIETLSKMMQLDYPPSKLHIYICDDGYFKSDFSKVGQDQHWPSHSRNSGNLKAAGDVRQMVQDFLLESDADTPDSGTHPFLTTREVMPDTSSETRAVPRIDCAVGFLEDTYRVPGMPVVSYVARVKPKTHHAKAGNINNVLFNVGASGRYAAIFDNDMAPHPKFLCATLPLFYERAPEQGPEAHKFSRNGRPAKICNYTDAVEFNQLAYVQTPQYFKKNDLMMEQDDPLSHNNGVFFDAGMQGMDGYDSAMFVGTNCIWRREALDSIGGIQYGTISEDFWTGHHAHWLGWDSAYFRKDLQGDAEHRFRLSEGNVPDNVAASLAQRKRWHKGGVELFLGVRNNKDKDWVPPQAEVPQRMVSRRVRWFRKFHWFLARISWINVFPALFYTALTIGGLWTNRLWLYLNTVPSYAFMVPYLLINNFNLSLGNSTVSAESWVGSTPEYFSYACVKTIGTFEAFYSKVTGRPAAWGNTGGIRKGSLDEVPNVIIVILLAAGLARSIVVFFFISTDDQLFNTLPLWAFSLIQLDMYWKMARVSIQEFFGWNYKSLNGTKAGRNLIAPIVMAAAITLQVRSEGGFDRLFNR
jgi:cellulose synthase/poly-beta-1,6-N-acetylglucosamine synthase-like glycosyltransferase